MIKYVLASTHVSDEDKVALCTGRKAMECAKWLEEFNERSKKRLQMRSGTQQLLRQT